MPDLKSQLLKAKLLDPKHARKMEHQERVRRKEIGRDAFLAEKETRQREQEERARQRKIEDRRQSDLRKKAEEERKAARQVEDILAGAEILAPGHGSRRFHFVASDGRIPCIEVSDVIAIRLEKGTAAIVEAPGSGEPEFLIVPADVAGRVRQSAPDAIRFWIRE